MNETKNDMSVSLSEIQQKELEILKAVVALCERHNIRYYMDAGTLLGAVRHKGPIPWDDDVDIAMLRPDYERFCRIAAKELPAPLKLVNGKTTRGYYHLWSKVHDSGTTFVEEENLTSVRKDGLTGVWVDIFPYDGVSSSRVKNGLFRLWLRCMKPVDWVLRTQPEDVDSAKGKLVFLLLGWLKEKYPYYWATDKIEGFLSKRAQNGKTYEGYMEGVRWYTKNGLPGSVFGAGTPLAYEDTTFIAPSDWDGYLKFVYGDYMTPPPPEKRNSGHHIAYVNLHKPVAEFVAERMAERDG